MKIHPHLIPSVSNIAGAMASILFAGGYSLICHRDTLNQRFFNETATHIAASHGYDVVTIAMVIGAVIALFVSFFATHLVEKLWKK